MLEKLDNIAFSNDVGFDDIDSGVVSFFSDGMGLTATDLPNIKGATKLHF